MRHYVYKHIDPETKEVRYIGRGTSGRAWACGFTKNQDPIYLKGARRKEHYQWMSALMNKGYTPGDWVQIVSQGLTKRQSVEIESQEIAKCESSDLLFNVTSSIHRCTALTREEFDTAVRLRKEGLSYQKIADRLGTAHYMTIYRALTGETKGYQEWLPTT